MCYGNHGVCTCLFLQQDIRHRFSDNVTPSDDDHMLPRRVIAASNKKFLNPNGCARLQRVFPDHKFSHIHRVEPVDVFSGVNSLDDFWFADVFREWELNKYAVNL